MSPVIEWDQRRLGEVTIPASTWSPSRDPRPSIRYIDVSAVSRDEFRIVSEATYSADSAPSRARKIVEAGDTIFATVRPTLRRIAQIPASLDGEIVSTAFCVLRPDLQAIDADFLYFATQLESVMEGIASMESGASYPAVRDVDVLDQVIPLPPLPEQGEIAAVLNTIRTASLHQVQCEVNATALKRATMQELFTHGLRGEAQKETEIGPVPESWATVLIGEQAQTISKGASPKWQGFNYVNEGVLFVRSQNVGDGIMEWDEKVFLSPEWNKKERRSILRSGDLLINLVGASIGRSAVGGDEIDGANCNQAVCFVRLNQDQMHPKFLCAFLWTFEGQRQIHDKKKDIARANLSLEDVRQMRVPKPNPDEQREIVSILDAIDRKIDLHRRKRAVLDDLFKALLHRLMAGEIRVADLDLSAVGETTPYSRIDEGANLPFKE